MYIIIGSQHFVKVCDDNSMHTLRLLTCSDQLHYVLIYCTSSGRIEGERSDVCEYFLQCCSYRVFV